MQTTILEVPSSFSAIQGAGDVFQRHWRPTHSSSVSSERRTPARAERRLESICFFDVAWFIPLVRQDKPSKPQDSRGRPLRAAPLGSRAAAWLAKANGGLKCNGVLGYFEANISSQLVGHCLASRAGFTFNQSPSLD